jgi:hypothetical protein
MRKVIIKSAFDLVQDTKEQIALPIFDKFSLSANIIGEVRINKKNQKLIRLDKYKIIPAYYIKKRNDKGVITEIEITEMYLVKDKNNNEK